MNRLKTESADCRNKYIDDTFLAEESNDKPEEMIEHQYTKLGAVCIYFVPLWLDNLNQSDIDMKKLLLISNSASQGQPYLGYAAEEIGRFLGPVGREVLFVPYAAITYSWDEYVDKVNKALGGVGVHVTGLHTCKEPLQAIASAQAIMVGGGNTWALLNELQDMGAIQLIRERVLLAEIPYVGWSAGSNLACPTIMTTNDMPICEPVSTDALGLISFQINPHYLDAHPEGYGGETREQRIREFVKYNPDHYVLGLREGSMLHITGDKIFLRGEHTARLFHYPLHYDNPLEVDPGTLEYSERELSSEIFK